MKTFSRRWDILTSYHIKVIALIFMTVDHIGAYAFEIPLISDHYSFLRLLGRIAAPLFLYMVTESARYTHSRLQYILRLYVAAVLVGLTATVTNCFLGDLLGYYSHSNILFTYFYTVLYIALIDNLIKSIQHRNWKQLILMVVGLLCTYIPHLIRKQFYALDTSLIAKNLFESFIQSPLLVEYSPLFVLLGILIYFAKNKWTKIGMFIVFCLISYSSGIAMRLTHTPLSEFFGYPQYWMILATPIMMLYNGKKGKNTKLLFYLYYPIHRFVIIIISFFFGII